jgi:penicillin-binding protein 2
MRIEVETEGNQPPRHGIVLLQAMVIFLFCVLLLRFWYLQVLRGEHYETRAYSNRWKNEQISANRGLILDSNGVILAENSPAYSVAIIREDCPDVVAALAQVSKWTDLPLAVIQNNYEQAKDKTKKFDPLILVSSIDFNQLSLIESQKVNWPGIIVLSRQRRYYTHGDLFAHVLGYVSIASDEDHKKYEVLSIGDTVGKQGLEVMLEDRLRGRKGLSSSEVNVHGRQLLRNVQFNPGGGENIRLSMDLNLQIAATQALGNNAGCVIIMEPDTGKLRALVTAPSYDNNIFTGKLSDSEWGKLRDDPRHPLHNRVIQSVYPPGSTWKLLMAGILLTMGVDPAESITCTGSVHLGSQAFRCWKPGGHGRINMLNSLVESCDSYYYLMGERAGIDRITAMAMASGFGRLTGINLPYEKPGLVPSREWKKANFAQDPGWQKGETFNTSIGQGFTLVTPMQMAVYVSALLNGGKLMKPVVDDTAPPEVTGHLPLTEKNLKFIVDAMRQTVEAQRGTAKRIRRSDAVMGGKTGTAQVIRLGDVRVKAGEMPYEHRDHAWVVSWGMKGEHKYVVVVMVEHGGGGSSTAGPITAAVYDYLFGDTKVAHRQQAGLTDSKSMEKQGSAQVEDILRAGAAWQNL